MLHSVRRPLLKSARNFHYKTLRNQSCLSRSSFKVVYSTGEFFDFSFVMKISAFLDEALNFFVTYFFQEKKVNRVLQNWDYFNAAIIVRY